MNREDILDGAVSQRRKGQRERGEGQADGGSSGASLTRRFLPDKTRWSVRRLLYDGAGRERALGSGTQPQ
jgi:hypothetical protein